MNRRKIENWVIFGLKLLPFLMLILFAVYIHRHGIDNFTVPNSSSTVVNSVNLIDSLTSSDLKVTEDNNIFYYHYDTLEVYHSEIIDNYLNFYIILPVQSGEGVFNFDISFFFIDRVSDVMSFEVNIREREITFNYIVNDSNLYHDDLYIDEVYISAFNDFSLYEDFSYVAFNLSFDIIDVPGITLQKAYIDSISFDGNNLVFYSFNKSFLSYDNVNPINASFIYFNNFLDHNINLEIFNIQEFYDWTVNSWFNGNAPVFYKPVFLILIYELIIDLLILLYSFITFVIKFAEKWLNGIYNKEWQIMKKFLLSFSILLSFLLIFAITPIIKVDAADNDFPSKEYVSGWYTFTNTSILRTDALYLDYPGTSIDGYPTVNSGTTYTIYFPFTLAYLVEDPTLTDAVGEPLKYSLAKGIIIDTTNDIGSMSFIFSNPGVEVYEQVVEVYDGTYWINDNYKQILITKNLMPFDFITFLTANGTFNYIPGSSISDVTDLIITYVDIPTRIMHGMLDINVMGTTLFGIVVGIITIVFIVYLFKRIL